MEPDLKIENKIKGNVKAFVWTAIIFALIVFIWLKTNPLFTDQSKIEFLPNLDSQINSNFQADSVGQSFKTMWSGILDGFNKMKKQ